MKCKEIKSLLSAYLDDEVSRDEKQAIKLHLEECKDCSELLLQLKETKSLLSEIAEEPIPREVAEKVKAGIREAERAKKTEPSKDIQESFWSRKALGYIFAFAGVLVVLIVVLIPLRGALFFSTEPAVKLAPTSPPRESKSLESQKGAAPQAEKREAEGQVAPHADSLVAGGGVQVSDTNYDKRKVNELLDSYERTEEQTAKTDTFSADRRDVMISSMLTEAQGLKLDAHHLDQCFGVLVSHNESILPVYAEKTRFEGKDVWIVIVNEFSSDPKSPEMRAYVLTTPVCEIILEVD